MAAGKLTTMITTMTTLLAIAQSVVIFALRGVVGEVLTFDDLLAQACAGSEFHTDILRNAWERALVSEHHGGHGRLAPTGSPPRVLQESAGHVADTSVWLKAAAAKIAFGPGGGAGQCSLGRTDAGLLEASCALHAPGGVRVGAGDGDAACTAANAGAIRYSAGTGFEGCHDESWGGLGGGAGPDGGLALEHLAGGARPAVVAGHGVLFARAAPDVAAGEPIDEHTQLLLHFDKDLADTSGRAHAVTADGGAAVGSAQKKFGAGALDTTPGSGGAHLQVAASPAFDFGTGEYTVEMWLMFNENVAGGTGGDYDDKIVDAGGYFRFGFKGYSCGLKMGGERLASNALWGPSACLSPGADTWHHYVWQRRGNMAEIFYDGLFQMQGTAGNALDGSGGFAIGATPSGGEKSAAWIDEVRISTGVARYGASFDASAMVAFGDAEADGPPLLFYLDPAGTEYTISLTKVESEEE